MPDDFDYATEQRDELLANQIDSFRFKNAERICLPVGTCYNCGDPIDEPLLYCPGGECQSDHEKRKRHAEINR